MIEINVEIPQREIIENTVTIIAKPSIVGVTATVDDNIGTPYVDVTPTGTGTEYSFDLAFHNLRGADGANAEITNVTASVDSSVGIPSVDVTMGGTAAARTFDFAFHNLKGIDGSGAVSDVKVNNVSVLSPEGVANIDLTGYQPLLVSGTSIKTINSASVLGSGNLTLADISLSNLSTSGENRLHALKAYLDNGTLLTDGQGLADLKAMAHTTFDVNKFTVTGSPTITTDGIASGFSSSNYITIPDLDVTGEDFEFDFGKITTPSTINDINTLIAGTTSGKRFIVAITNEGKFYVSSGSSNFSTIIRNTAVTTNTDYYLKAGITGSSVYLKVSTDGTNWDTTTGSVTTAYTALQAELVGGGSTIAPYTGQLNLKDFVVRIGGAPVFTGNQTGSQTYTIGGSSVTIPYTITKQGISIVDSYYRTQVTALGNQEGWTPFFTLSDTDYTLPIGCMYGMIERNAHSANSLPSTKSKDLTLGVSTSTYTAPADGWFCLQFIASSMACYARLTNVDTNMETEFTVPAAGAYGSMYIPARKGEVVMVTYTDLTVRKFFFAYAQGAAKEIA